MNVKTGSMESLQCFGSQTSGQNAFNLLLRQKETHTLIHSQSLSNYIKILNSVKQTLQHMMLLVFVGEATGGLQ